MVNGALIVVVSPHDVGEGDATTLATNSLEAVFMHRHRGCTTETITTIPRLIVVTPPAYIQLIASILLHVVPTIIRAVTNVFVT